MRRTASILDKISSWLLCKPEDAFRRGTLWNLFASLVNAAEAVVVMMVATRTVGVQETGILSISFTVANLMTCVGKFGVRSFQVTDAGEEFRFSEYLRFRFRTMLLMAVSTAAYLAVSVAFRGYSFRKAWIVVLVVLIYSMDAWEDVFAGRMQQKGRLDTAAKMFALRWCMTLLAWTLGLTLLRDVIISSAIALAVSAGFCYLQIRAVEREARSGEKGAFSQGEGKKLWRMAKSCLPLCVSSLLYMYLPNASKYAIDSVLSDTEQAYYGFVSMPVFVVSLASTVILQPYLVQLSEEWGEGERKKLIALVGRLGGLIGISAVLILAAGFLFGIPVLSLIYGVDLSGYKTEMMLLLTGGAAIGFIGLFGNLLTVTRRQEIQMICYAVVSLSAVFSTEKIVAAYGTVGAALANMIYLAALEVLVMIGALIVVDKDKR